MKTKNGARFVFIFGLAFFVIIAILFLFRAQSASAQKTTRDDAKQASGQNEANLAGLKLSKKSRGHTYDHIGQLINYSYVIRNTSGAPITGTFTIADDKLVASCTQPPGGVLQPNARMTCKGTYAITQADMDTGHVTNHATASGGGATSNQASLTITATQRRLLQLTKVAIPSTYDHIGQLIEYSYVVLNSGNVTLAGTFSVTDNKVTTTCTQPADGALSPGETMNCTATYTITQADLDAGTVTNLATATGGGVTSNQATATVSAIQTRSLLLTKTASPLIFDQVGQQITYSYTIKNTGDVTLTGPFSVADDKAVVTCSQPGDNALSPGETMNCTATYTITQADLNAGSVTNRATASGGGVGSNEDSATVVSSQAHGLLLAKLGEPQTYNQIGQLINYAYVIMNTTNLSLTGPFSVVDDKAAVTCTQPADGSLSPQETMDCAGTYLITQSDLDAGSVINLATASGGGATSNQANERVFALQNRSLILVKSAASLTYDHVGQVIDYNYVITNIGNVTLIGPFTVTDDKVTVTCTQPPGGALLPQGIMDCAAAYVITQADLDVGNVINRATASGGQATSNQAIETVSAVQTKSLLLTKAADPLTYSQVGDTITYSYTLQNTGNITLAGPFSVTDDHATVACTPPGDGALSPGERMECTATYDITQADLDAGFVTNLATASAGSVSSNEDSATVVAAQATSLLLTKAADPLTYDHVGQEITYSYVILNAGNVTLSGPFSVTDDKATVTCIQPGDGALSPGETMDCSAVYTITQTDLDSGSAVNLATATGGGATSNEATESVFAIQTGSLLLAKTATPHSYDHIGQTINYSYLITNTGNITLQGTFLVADNKANVTCTQPVDSALSPGETMGCASTYTITQADLDVGTVLNLATASGAGVISNQASETATAQQAKSLLLAKSAEPLTYDHIGQIINYSYTITNTGNVTLVDEFSVLDNKATVTCTQPGGGVLSPGESMDCTAAYAITLADLQAGSVTNQATASGAGAVSNQASATVTVAPTKSLQLSKVASPLTYDHAGQVIDYSYTITNTGNIGLAAPFAVADNKTTVTCTQPGDNTLSPGEAMGCAATYTITQADLDAGHVTNLATASGDGASSNQATATVNAVQNASLLLTKTADPQTYDHAGQVITYTYDIENDGNVTLSGPFTVFDDKSSNESCPASPSQLAPGQSISCTATYTILLSDLVSGAVTNNAYATGKFGGNTVTSNTDAVTINYVRVTTYYYLPLLTNSAPYGIHILPNSYNYVSHSTMFVIGEVLNSTGDTLKSVGITVNFYDSGGHMVGGGSAYMWPINLPAGDKGCIKIPMAVPQGWSYYQFGTPTYSTNVASSGLTITSRNGSYNQGTGSYDIAGQVQNYGSTTSTAVSVSGTLYDAAGLPIGCEFATVAGSNLIPGQFSTFNINFSGYYRNYNDVAYYKLRVTGNPQ